MLAKTINGNPKFNESVQNLKVVLMILIIWLYTAVEIRSLLILALGNTQKPETLSFYLSFLGAFPVIYSVMTLLSKKEEEILLRDIKSLKSVWQVEYLIHRLSKLIQKRHNPNHFIKLHGFLKLHAKNHLRTRIQSKGQVQGLPASQASLGRLESLRVGSANNLNSIGEVVGEVVVNPWEELIYQEMKGSGAQQDPDAEDKQVNLYNRFLEYLIKQGLKNFPKSASLRLYLAYFQYFTLKTHWKPVYLLRQTFALKSSLMEEFAARRTLKIIELDLRIKEEQRRAENDLDVIKVVTFSADYKEFMKTIARTVNMTLDFWIELSNQNPDSNKLMSLGSHILKQNLSIKGQFETLAKSEVRTSQMYSIFAGYIKLVMHDEENFSDVIDRVESRNKSGLSNIVSASDLGKNVQDRELAERMNASMCVLEVSGNEDSLGEIRMVSNSVWNLFGYKPGELIGQNVDCLMPKFYAERHDLFMQRYLLQEKKTVMDVARVVFGLHRDGFINNFKLLLKYLPDLSEGIRLIGILTPCAEKDFKQLEVFESTGSLKSDPLLRPEVHTLLLNYTTGDIIGVSNSLYHAFGLKSQLFNQANSSNSPNIELIAPEIVKADNLGLLRSESGLICSFDTTVLNDNYYFVGSQDDRRGDGHRNIMRKRKMVQEARGNGVPQEEFSSSEDSSEMRERGENGGSEDVVEKSPFEQESFDEEQELFRGAQIRAWFDKEAQYGDSRVLCLRFVEEVDLDGDVSQKDSCKKYLKDVPDESKVSVVDLDHSPKNRGGSGVNYRNILDSSENDSFDQMRIVKLTREVIEDKKSGLVFSLTNFVAFISFTIIGSYIAGYYFETAYFKEFESHFTSKISMFRRGLAISDIRFYNRKLELLSSGWLTVDKQSEHDKAAEAISKLSDLLVKYEDDSMDALNDMRRIRGKILKRYVYDFNYKLSDGRNSFIKSQYQDGIFQYLSSASIIKNSKLGELDRRGEAHGKGARLSKERMHFYRINYNSIKPLRKGNKEIMADYSRFIDERILDFRIYTFSPVILHFILSLIGSPIAVFCAMRILNNDGDVLRIFSLISYQEIEMLVEEIDTFREEYLRDFLTVEDINFGEEHSSGGEGDYLESRDGYSESSGVDSSQGAQIEMIDEKKGKTRQNSRMGEESGQEEYDVDSSAVANPDVDSNLPSGQNLSPDNIEFLKEKRAKKKKNRSAVIRPGSPVLPYDRNSKRGMTYQDTGNMSKLSSKSKKKRRRIKKLNLINKRGSVSSKNSPADKNQRGKRKRKLLLKKNESKLGKKSQVLKMRKSSKGFAKAGMDSPTKHKVGTKTFRFTVTPTRAAQQNQANEEEDEIAAQRTQQIMAQSTIKGKCFLIANTIPRNLILLVLIGVVFLLKQTSVTTMTFINESTSKLGLTPSGLKTSFNVMYESLALPEYPYLIDGKDIFEDYMEMGYANIGSLTQNNEFPNFMTEYSEIFNELVFVGICEKFIRTQTNETCSEELYNTGLETISIYILENSRKQLNIFAQGKDREDTAKKLIQSDEVAQLEKIVMLTGDIFDYLFEIYSSNIVKVISVYEAISLTVLSLTAFTYINYLLYCLFYIIPYLKRQVMKSRGMLKIIPTEILIKNKRIQSILMKGKEDLDRHKKLRRKRRRNLAKGY